MRRLAPLLAVLLCACAGGGTAYRPDDPLSRRQLPQDFYRTSLSTGTAGAAPLPAVPGATSEGPMGPSGAARARLPVFRAVLPQGYGVSDGLLGPPFVSLMTKALPDGEAAVSVEWYGEGEGVDRDSFVRQLSPGPAARAPSRHVIGGRTFEAYHGIDFESYARSIPEADPYGDSLGSMPLPGLSPLDRRKFPVGGDAYRLYRCRKLGAWGLLADYGRAQRLGEGKGYLPGLSPRDRRVVAACFGRSMVSAMEAGAPAPRARKPAMRDLRLMARDEREHGAARLVERECVYIRPVPGAPGGPYAPGAAGSGTAPAGFYVLRLKAPRDDFAGEHEDFETFLSSFEPLESAPAR